MAEPLTAAGRAAMTESLTAALDYGSKVDTKCPDCAETVTRSNLSRHRKRRHAREAAPTHDTRLRALERVAKAARAYGFCDRTDKREACNLLDCPACVIREALTDLDAREETS